TTFTNYNITNGFIDKFVYSIATDHFGNVWFGTSEGITEYIYDNTVNTIEQTKNENGITLFPNPASNMVSLNIDSENYQNINNEDFEMNVYNMMGKLVKTAVLKQNQNQINMDDLSNGIYMLIVKSKSVTTTKKLIIQK
ncbi:MAG TPA: T9SS type A sorting domain-containing protein, partial [Bacteroidales bacterium]|nr:T9SS type A sorting domain-containing protein [Bacteroidales bacterium]